MTFKLLTKEQDASAFRFGRLAPSLAAILFLALQVSMARAIDAAPPIGTSSVVTTSARDAVERNPSRHLTGVDDRHSAMLAQAAAPAASDAPAASTAQDGGGIPGWVWLLLAVIVIGIVLWLLNRRKKDAVGSTTRGRDEPIIKTRK